MEELGESFELAFHVTLDENDTSLIHPRYSQYKQKTSKTSQEERRRKWLQLQKEKRLDALNEHRDFTVINNSNKSKQPPKKHHAPKLKKAYKDSLMLSEWLVDVPEDLEQNWIVKPCPEGKRVLVVVERGRGTAYGRNGHTVMSFNSVLPGGSQGTSTTTLLDCVWSPSNKVVYVLDVIFWGCLLTNCEAEFRFFWLHNKLCENPEVSIVSKKNQYRFEEVVTCSDLKTKLVSHPYYEQNQPKLDGVIFYHKEGHYATGVRSPLVTWLKPFMLPTILNIPVNPEFLNEVPPQYQKMDTSEVTEEAEKEPKILNCDEMC